MPCSAQISKFFVCNHCYAFPSVRQLRLVEALQRHHRLWAKEGTRSVVVRFLLAFWGVYPSRFIYVSFLCCSLNRWKHFPWNSHAFCTDYIQIHFHSLLHMFRFLCSKSVPSRLRKPSASGLCTVGRRLVLELNASMQRSDVCVLLRLGTRPSVLLAFG